MRNAIWVGFVLRLFVAVWNGFWGPSFGAEGDAASFHYWASEFSRQPAVDYFNISLIYSYMLGYVYYLTTDSLFIGGLLSCVAWLISSELLIKIMHLLSIDKHQMAKVMLIYALLPSSIFYTSVTLREVYQLLFVNMAVYCAIKYYLKKSTLQWIPLILSVVGMSVLHGALLAFGILMLVATLGLQALGSPRRKSLIKNSFVVALMALIILYGLSISSGIFYEFDDGLSAAVEKYQQGSLATDARSNYKDSVEIRSMVDLLLFVPISLFQYLFEPMLWRITSIIDLVTMSENVLRAWLIWQAWVNMRKMYGQKRRLFIFILMMYFALESIWSLGTINWGTAMRHHLPSIGLLLIIALGYKANKANAQTGDVQRKQSNLVHRAN